MELPDFEQVKDQLREELPPLSQWRQVAVSDTQLEYYHKGQFEGFEYILKAACSDELEKMPQYINAREERLDVINSLATYYVGRAIRAADPVQRDEFFEKATNYQNKASAQDINNLRTWVSKGYILLAKGQLDSAVEYFKNTLSKDRNCVPAMLGKACVLFNKGTYSEALEVYQDILKVCPRAPANIRLGVALCQYKLGNRVQALKALKRAEALHFESADIYMAKAILSLEEGDMSTYLQFLTKAFRLNPAHLLANLHVARHYFYRQDYTRSAKIAEASLSRITDSEKAAPDMGRLRAEFYLTMAQCAHAQGDLEAAFRYYSQAVKADDSNALVQFGLGQLYIHQGDITKAIACFEAVQRQQPHNYETLRVLGSLYAKQHKKEEALEKLQEVVKINPNDYEAWIEIAQIHEYRKPDQALEAYERALKGLPSIPTELWNNIAILRHKTGNQVGAEEAYKEASAKPSRTTMYNMARWHEDNGRFEDAKTLYLHILEEYKTCSEAHLRLGLIARQQGDYDAALKHTRAAIPLEKVPVNALCQKGQLEAELGEIRKAMETFNKVIQDFSHHDLYAMLAMGNLNYESALRNCLDLHKFENDLKGALKFYLKVLSLDEHNLYAAVGAGIFLAEMGDLRQATDTFKLAFDSSSSSNFILVNTGHIHMLQDKFEPAVKLYQRAKERNALEADVLDQYIAFAQYRAGNYLAAAVALKPLLDRQPQAIHIFFNYAYCLHQHTVKVFKQETFSFAEAEQAIACSQEAVPIYERILRGEWELTAMGAERREEQKRLQQIAFDRARAELEPARFQLEHGNDFLAKARRIEDETQRMQIEQQKRLNLIKEREERILREQQEREAEEKRKLEELASTFQQHSENLTKEWVAAKHKREDEPEEETARKKKPRKNNED